jgi:hypothetical protein
MVSLSSVLSGLSLWRKRRPFDAKHCRPFDAKHDWDDRHASHGTALTGVGHIGLSEAQNYADYEAKISKLTGLLERQIGPSQANRSLMPDAGLAYSPMPLRSGALE